MRHDHKRAMSPMAMALFAAFDPATFMNTTYSEANSTKVIPCPIGEYTAVIDDLKGRSPSKPDGSPMLDIFWKIDDASGTVTKLTGRKNVRVKQTVFLDFTDDGGLDFSEGKNVQLGRVRDAVGQNQKGQPWQPAMLKGGVAKIRVTNRQSDKPGDDTIYDDVGMVSKL